MKSLIASIMILGLVGMVVGIGVGAVTSANVSATVTAELITITVDDGSVDYGILPTGATENTTTNGNADGTQTVQNGSNVAVNLETKSSDAVGGTGWNLANTAGADIFTHGFCTTTCDSSPNWTAFDPSNTTYVSMATNIAVSGTQDFDLEIGTPVSVSDNVLKTITVTVLATASL